MVYFSDQKLHFGYILEDLQKENVRIFYGNFIYFAVTWYFYTCPLGSFVVSWYIVKRLGKLYQENLSILLFPFRFVFGGLVSIKKLLSYYV
jgi:hypothetical protein